MADAGATPAKNEKPDPTLEHGVSDIKRQVDKGDLQKGEQQLSHVFASWVAEHKGQDPKVFWQFMEKGLGKTTLLDLSKAYADDKTVLPGLEVANAQGATPRITAESVEKHIGVVQQVGGTNANFEEAMDRYLQQALKTDPEAKHFFGLGQQFFDQPSLDARVAALNAENQGHVEAGRIAQTLLRHGPNNTTLFDQLSTKGAIDPDKVQALQQQITARTAPGLSKEDVEVVGQLSRYFDGLNTTNQDEKALQSAIDGLGGSNITRDKVASAKVGADRADAAAAKEKLAQQGDIFDALTNMSAGTDEHPGPARKLFPPGKNPQMTQATVQAALQDPTLSRSDRDTLQRLADDWPDWARGANHAPQPISLSDVVRAAGTTQPAGKGPVTNAYTTDGKPGSPVDMKKVDADEQKWNANVTGMLGVLSAAKDFDPTNANGIVGSDGTITHDTIKSRLAAIAKDPNAAKDPNTVNEAKALRLLDSQFDSISRDGHAITGTDLQVYAANHHAQAADQKTEHPAPPPGAPQAPGNDVLSDAQKQAQTGAWKKIDQTQTQDQVDRLKHGETLYAFAERHLGPNASNKEIFTWLNQVMSASGFQKANLNPNKSHYTMHDLPRDWNRVGYHTDLHIGGAPMSPEQKHEAREKAGEQTIGAPASYLHLTQAQVSAVKKAWAQAKPNQPLPEEAVPLVAAQLDAQMRAQGKPLLTDDQIKQAQAAFAAARQAMEARLKAYEAQLAKQAKPQVKPESDPQGTPV